MKLAIRKLNIKRMMMKAAKANGDMAEYYRNRTHLKVMLKNPSYLFAELILLEFIWEIYPEELNMITRIASDDDTYKKAKAELKRKIKESK